MYYILILIILLCYKNWYSKSKADLQEKSGSQYSWFICVFLVVLAAFRSDSVGADTLGYRLDYESLCYYKSLEALVDRYTIYYIGYFGLSKLFHMAGMPVQVWFGFIEAFYLYSLLKLVNKFSRDKIFSLLIFTTIGLYAFSMAGLKQTFAASLMMLSFVFFIEKKYVNSALLIFATYYTHQAALIMLGAFPIYLLRNNKWLVHVVICLCICIYLYSFMFMETMVSILGNEKWEGYLVTDSGYSYVTFIFYVTVTIASYINIKGYSNELPEEARLFFGLSALGCALQLLAGVSPSLFRLALLYTPFFMILIPNCFYYSQSKTTKFFVIGCVIFYFLYTGRNWPYSFYF